jgi:hypothetical protein
MTDRPLDDLSPTIRERVLQLRRQDLDPATVETIAEVMWALAMPAMIAHLESMLATMMKARETKWRAHTERLKAEIRHLQALQRDA